MPRPIAIALNARHRRFSGTPAAILAANPPGWANSLRPRDCFMSSGPSPHSPPLSACFDVGGPDGPSSSGSAGIPDGIFIPSGDIPLEELGAGFSVYCETEVQTTSHSTSKDWIDPYGPRLDRGRALRLPV